MLISYAQNFEDVILWRALKHVERGFYIDVGAYDPIVDSVSLAFYEQGWRGVHVEPSADYADKLRDARPDETVIQKAIGSEADKIVFWEFPDTGLSTGVRAIAEKHQRDGRLSKETNVACVPLSTILDDYRGRDIHWLKIDVEGMERFVIESWPPSPVRPWIVVVESTKPNSQEESFAEWESSLIDLGYEFVYFDGLNRFYLSIEHSTLKRSFGPGPNFFDSFMLSANAHYCHLANSEFKARLATNVGEVGRLNQELATAQAENQILLARLAANESELSRLSQIHAENEVLLARLATNEGEFVRLHSAINRQIDWSRASAEHVRQLTEQLDAIRSSPSWRMTAPLRECARVASRIRIRMKRGAKRRRQQPAPADRVALPTRDAIETRPRTQTTTILADAMKGWRLGKRLDA